MGWFRSLWLGMFGWMSRKGGNNARNVNVQTAAFDNAIKGSEARYQELSTAVAGLIRLEEDNVEELKGVTTRIESLTKVKTGAVNKAKKVAAALQGAGKTKEQIEGDGDYIACMKGFQDATKALQDQEERADFLEGEISKSKKTLATYKAELSSIQRDKGALEREKRESIADIQIAERNAQVAKLLNGVSQDTTSKDLQSVRDARKQARAEARLASELAGTDSKALEADFIREADMSAAASDFSKLIGLDDSSDSPALDHAKLPE